MIDASIAAVLPGGLVVLEVPSLCRVQMAPSGRVVGELMKRGDAKRLVKSINRGHLRERAVFVTYGSIAQSSSS